MTRYIDCEFNSAIFFYGDVLFIEKLFVKHSNCLFININNLYKL